MGDAMHKRLIAALSLCYRAGQNLVENLGIEMAGYLTFMIILALFPYLLLMVSAAGMVGQGEMGRELIELTLAHLPVEAVKTIRPRIVEIVSGPPHGLLTFAVLGAIWTSSSVIEGIRSLLNRAYCVSAPPAYLARRLTSIVQVLLFTSLILVAFTVLVLTPIAVHYVSERVGLGLPTSFKQVFNRYFLVFGAVAAFAIVSSLYYVLPNLRQTRACVFPGAGLVVALWGLGALAVSYYVQEFSQLNLIYGSLSGFIATLIFFYVMILMFIYGAEFNHELAMSCGWKVEARESPARRRRGWW